MKIITLAIFLFTSFYIFGQNIIKGKVIDAKGLAIPGVRVSIENTTYGVATNIKGDYFIEVNKKDTVFIKYQMVGFETIVDTLLLLSSQINNDVTLLEKNTSLSTVEIYADKRNIAKEVIGNVIANKKKLRNQYENYECTTYIKTSLEKEKRKNKIDKDSLDADGNAIMLPNKKEKMNLIESNSITQFKQKNTYKETILAHHDYAEKSSSSGEVSVSFGGGINEDDLLPTQIVEYNPYIFFEKVQDGDFDLYQNLVDLPKVSSNPIVSPFAVNAFINYKFTLNTVFIEDGQKIYDIIVEPRFKQAPLFSGNVYIIDSLWVVKSIDLSINPATMTFFKDFRIIQDFENIDGNWVVVRREFNYLINDFTSIVQGNTRVNHTGYQFDLAFDKKTFKNVLLEYKEDAFDKDSTYWSDIRPIQLKKEEIAYIHEQDSITDAITNDVYVDSVNRAYNKIRFWDILLSGVGFRNREKKQEIYISPIISQVQPFGMGGYRHRLGGMYSKEFKNAQQIKVDGQIDYGFRNKDVKGMIGVAYTFLPQHFGSFKISGGDMYDMVTMDQSVTGIFSRSNFVRKTFIQLSQRYELTNGLYGKIGFDYSTRRDISDIAPAPWAVQFIDAGFWTQPAPYDTYTVSIFEVELLYRFKQKYILKGNKKIIVGTTFPELRLTFRKGVPNLFNSDVNFEFLEIAASDKVDFGTFGDLKWNVKAGTFFGKETSDLQFIERKFFRGSDLFLFSNPLGTMQLLDSTFNTARPYFQAFGIHHFNGAILNKIPLINRLKLGLVGGAAALLIEDKNYAHIEFYVGLERVIKIRKQLFKLSAYYVVRENNASSINFNFKIGLDFFNSYTNAWSY